MMVGADSLVGRGVFMLWGALSESPGGGPAIATERDSTRPPGSPWLAGPNAIACFARWVNALLLVGSDI